MPVDAGLGDQGGDLLLLGVDLPDDGSGDRVRELAVRHRRRLRKLHGQFAGDGSCRVAVSYSNFANSPRTYRSAISR